VPALLVAKAHKLHDRVRSARRDRLEDKDAADVFRMMQVAPAASVGATLAKLREHPIAGPPTAEAIGYIDALFGRRGRLGIQMAARSFGGAIPPARIEAVSVAYTAGLREALGTI
jgi:hypothetical protein